MDKKMKSINNIIIENATIRNRNFEGRKEKPFNPQGKREFTVMFDDEELVEQLMADGWNVKASKHNGEDPELPNKYFLSVSVNFDGKYPPRIIQITKSGGRLKKTPINEDTAALIDSAEIKNINLEITPNTWTMPDGKSGVRAYLKTMYYELVEDVFAHLYEDDDFIEQPFDLD